MIVQKKTNNVLNAKEKGSFFNILYNSEGGESIMENLGSATVTIDDIIPKPETKSKTKSEIERNSSEIYSPNHYSFGGIEPNDYIEAKFSPEAFRGYCIGNVIKYVSRAGKKDKTKYVVDLGKAIYYLNRAIKSYEAESQTQNQTHS